MREIDRGYLLRIWKDGKGDHAWRASLRELRSQETVYFKDFKSLYEYLEQTREAGHSSECD